MGFFENTDKFDIDNMTAEQHKEKQEYVSSKCKCKGCPTYVEGDADIGYCFPLIGTSANIKWEKECICEECDIWKEYALGHNHYCTRCSEVCQVMKTQSNDAP